MLQGLNDYVINRLTALPSARFPRIFRFALPGALAGIAFRTLLHLFIW
ncbi:hypothetical protein [Klebsiella pneumoniae]|nr:hypothetical protein [Klebsiella pneumoniae]SYK48119.1 Uncharacterised protein [Klebsiella pneumoniae]